jgi:hypothetical protein
MASWGSLWRKAPTRLTHPDLLVADCFPGGLLINKLLALNFLATVRDAWDIRESLAKYKAKG